MYLLFANADPDKGYKGVTAFMVERDMPGFSVGKKEDKLGIRASSTCELILEDVRVPRSQVVAEIGQGYKVAIETLNEGRIGIGAQMAGLAQGAFECALVYARERSQFGRAIADFQAIQFELAELATEIEAARLMVYNTARLKESGQPFAHSAAMTKFFCSQVGERGRLARAGDFRRCGFYQRLSRREVLPGRQDRQNLRGHLEYATQNHSRQPAEELRHAATCCD